MIPYLKQQFGDNIVKLSNVSLPLNIRKKVYYSSTRPLFPSTIFSDFFWVQQVLKQ
jgi:hypothetical protein